MARPSGRRTSQFHLPQVNPQPEVPSIENNFVGGLKTEYTGLNFPENACTAVNNCTFFRTGNVTRRNGFTNEPNASFRGLTQRQESAISTFRWTNAGGTGNQELMVVQIGITLWFYAITSATVTNPLSNQLNFTPVALNTFQSGSTSPIASECQYATGNGYLFVFNPNCDPFYCTFDGTNIVANRITIQIRDFIGLQDGLAVNQRPNSLLNEHYYNLLNQGWGANLNTPSQENFTGTGPGINNPGTYTFTVPAGLPNLNVSFIVGVSDLSGNHLAIGNLVSYVSTSLVVNITQVYHQFNVPGATYNFQVNGSSSNSFINTWNSQVGNFPSNADIWWTFKDSTDTFNPGTTVNSVTLNAGPAPKGYFVLNAFVQERSAVSGVSSITTVTTPVRPRTGAWFQGRVWYAGVDASQPITGDSSFYSWTENIYFSQIIQNTSQFGFCYETNDPTSEDLNTLLPSDGGVIQIQGCGSIYKLFPIVNGLIVFAANGIWFITGSTGIGFAANDFTVSKVSGEHSISGTSFVDIMGWPAFWNGDGIYYVQAGQSYTSGQTSLQVENLTLPTIKTFYQAIPLSSKKFARGSYNHITGVIQWIYNSNQATDTTTTYNFNSVLNFLTYTKSFYTWSLPTNTNNFIHSVEYVEGPGGLNVPPPAFKYFMSNFSTVLNQYVYAFAGETDTAFVDWNTTDGFTIPQATNYISSFQTGYKLKGQGQRKFQPMYIYMFSENPVSAYTFQGTFDYAISSMAGRTSGVQVVNNNKPLYGKTFRRHRVRGNGYVCQYVVGSVQGQPFSFAGWSVLDVMGIQ